MNPSLVIFLILWAGIFVAMYLQDSRWLGFLLVLGLFAIVARLTGGLLGQENRARPKPLARSNRFKHFDHPSRN